MLIGYIRASKADGSQALDLQRDALLAAGVQPEHLYEDLASGRRDDRPGLAACLKALRDGDTLVVWRLDRLGRDLRHLDLDQRRTLFRMVEARRPVGEIATRLGRHPSTIHRELGRNHFRDGDRGFRGYFPLTA